MGQIQIGLLWRRLMSTEKKEEMPALYELHVISYALQTGLKAVEWGTEEVLLILSTCKLLTSWNADFLKLEDTMQFPYRFSPIRWVENNVVAERGI